MVTTSGPKPSDQNLYMKVKEKVKKAGKGLSEKMAMIDNFVADEKALAMKNGDEISIGDLEDFEISGRDSYRFTNILGIDMNTYGYKKGRIFVIFGTKF